MRFVKKGGTASVTCGRESCLDPGSWARVAVRLFRCPPQFCLHHGPAWSMEGESLPAGSKGAPAMRLPAPTTHSPFTFMRRLGFRSTSSTSSSLAMATSAQQRLSLVHWPATLSLVAT